jgi:hypothetical protein
MHRPARLLVSIPGSLRHSQSSWLSIAKNSRKSNFVFTTLLILVKQKMGCTSTDAGWISAILEHNMLRSHLLASFFQEGGRDTGIAIHGSLSDI